ncbi:circadian locomoter output cycles protein kaput isoform X2 [Leptopilina boulardi]|uniref:circadian locomoter output cycles protein kaput isoform X2 n=1 Tax=Leptopilina boulardi TaxID=63433 RepID=UPI0021F69874|nr:circadian locomoter output cycles protein kaput isoform X2 [Leptopilina boulardi]
MANYGHSETNARQSDEAIDDDNDEKDDTKRKSRNLSEKKRRDQFNMLVNELGSMVNTHTRKMDKSTVLKSTILFLKNHNEKATKSRIHEIQEDWKPSFLSNEEFTHLILEALDGFIIVFSSNGRIYYTSESVTSLLGYLPNELTSSTIYEIAYQDDQSYLYNLLLNPENLRDQRNNKKDNQISFTCHIKRGGLDNVGDSIYELVQFIGYFRSDMDPDIDTIIPTNRLGSSTGSDAKTESLVFVGTGRLQTPQSIREMSVVDSTKSEFTSRHSLEWKFLFLDHRAPPIIGYLPFEVLGTSVMQKGEGTSCHYRFLTKGQQWIWLQTRFYITYNQWNSKPEFIVCTHRVLSYVDVLKNTRKNTDDQAKVQNQNDILSAKHHSSCQIRSSSWSSKQNKSSKSFSKPFKPRYQERGSDTTSISGGSQYSQANTKHSYAASQGSKSKIVPATSTASSITIPTTVIMDQPLESKIEESCINFLEPTQYTTVPIQSIVTGSCGPPSVPLNSPLPTSEILQQGIVMTPAQNHIQDELQRKHEELQQLIVYQQEELRKVSEKLLIAKYGIFSPIINVNIPYDPNVNQPLSRVISGEPIVQRELFNQQVTGNPVSRDSTTSDPNNMGQLLSQAQGHPQLHQMQAAHQQIPQQSASHSQIEENQDLMSYQFCQSNELIYTDMSSSVNQQQSST